MEADPCLIEAAVHKMGLQEAKGVATPGAKIEGPLTGADIKAR